MKTVEKIKKKVFRKENLLILIVLIIIGIIWKFFYHCPTEHLLGIPCPGCGMSRALFACLRLDFAEAFYFHPLFPVLIAIILFEILKWLEIIAVPKWVTYLVYGTFLVLLIITYIIRLITGSPVVAIDLEGGRLTGLFFR